MDENLETLQRDLDLLEDQCPSSALQIFYPLPAHIPVFQRLCQAFVAAAPQDRTPIQSLVAGKDGVQNCLLGFAIQSARELQSTKDESWLRTGLAAATLAKSGMDYRDHLMVLAELYVVAEEAGLDPDPAFIAVASLEGFGNYPVVLHARSGSDRFVPPRP